MLTEGKLVRLIIDLESGYDPTNDESYLDEYQQARLNALYEVLNRDLNKNEKLILNEIRENMYG